MSYVHILPTRGDRQYCHDRRSEHTAGRIWQSEFRCQFVPPDFIRPWLISDPFSQQFWKSYYNTLDLVITLFCGLTLIVIFFSGCSAKGEEVFDIFLLVVRNLFQFGRLALVMRKYVLALNLPANREHAADTNCVFGFKKEWKECVHQTSSHRSSYRSVIFLLT